MMGTLELPWAPPFQTFYFFNNNNIHKYKTRVPKVAQGSPPTNDR